MEKAEIRSLEPDYTHSSNAVFSFMSKAEYLEKALACFLQARFAELHFWIARQQKKR